MYIVNLLYGAIVILKEDGIITIKCLNDDNDDSTLLFEICDDSFEYYENPGAKSPSITFQYMDKAGKIHVCLLFLTYDNRLLLYGEDSNDILDFELLVNKKADSFNKDVLDDFFTYTVKRGTSYEDESYRLFSLNKFGEVIRSRNKSYEEITLYDDWNLIQGERVNHFDLFSLNGTLQLEGLETMIRINTIIDGNDKRYFIFDGMTYDDINYVFIVDGETGEIISFLDPSISSDLIEEIMNIYKTKSPSVKTDNLITGNFRKK